MSFAIVGGTVAIGSTVAGAVMSGSGKDSGPAPRDLNAEISAILGQGSNIYRSQAALAPNYNDLRLSNLNQLLWGTPAGSAQPTNPGLYAPRWRNMRTGEVSLRDPASIGGVNPGLWERFEVPPGTPLEDGSSGPGGVPNYTGNSGTAQGGTGQKGLVQQYSDLIPAANAANSATRTATYNDIRNLNPDASALFDELQKSASLGLKAGSTIAPEDLYKITSPIRADNANRGFAPGGAGDLSEALATFGSGQALLKQRQDTASGVSDLSNRLYTLPTLSSSATTNPANFLAGAFGAMPSSNTFDQLGGYGSDLFNTNFNAASAQSIANNNNQAATSGALLGLGGKLGSTLLENADWCWSAREIFGAHNPKWNQFALWMALRSPAKLRKWYHAHGAEWAERLKHAGTGTRAAVQRWMEKRIVSVWVGKPVSETPAAEALAHSLTH